jgi:biotin carboxylase
MPETKNILVINLGWEQQPLISRLKSFNYKLYGVNPNSNHGVTGFEQVHVCDLRDLQAIIDFADTVKPSAVISDQCDYSHFAQAVIADRFKIPGPRVSDALIASNKYLQRMRALASGVKIPRFRLITVIEDLYAFAKDEGYPFIVKPLDNRGSFGVTKVNCFDDIATAYVSGLTNSHSRLMLAEQFIAGTEITVDGYIFEGQAKSLALARKAHVDANTKVAVDIKYPGDIAKEVYERLIANNELVISKLQYTFGMTHAEYMVDKNNEIFLIEAANRGGGVFTSEIIVPYVSGIDLLSAYINDCLGSAKSRMPLQVERNPAILKFFSFRPGKIKSFDGISKIVADPQVLKFRLAVKEGDTIRPITNDANRHGFVIVEDKADVRRKADEVINSIKVTYET